MTPAITSIGAAALVHMPTARHATVTPGKTTALTPDQTQGRRAVFRHVNAVWSRLAAWKMRRATRIILASLDDRILRDIGLQRSEVDVVPREGRARAQRWPL
jgi:uncharacterized protein YjiS (DUF1127 family)